MTLELLNKLCAEHNIPKDVELLSDSGCECSETDMDGVFYDKETNTLIFTQRVFRDYRNLRYKHLECIY